MDSRRLNYLRALDIDVWERRDLAVTQAASEPVRASVAAVAPPAVAVHQVAPAAVSRVVAPPVAAPKVSALRTESKPSTRVPPRDDAVAAMGWDQLVDAVRTCTKCPLHATRTQGVFGVGDRKARWMIIGEAPGADEDSQGEPFVGRAGQLLNSMLRAMGLAREQVFIANVLKSRPPGNRDPRVDETSACLPYLFRQIELVNPTLLLCVGRIAAQTLLETDMPIGKLRGKLHTLPSGRPMIVTYHPAYLLRSPVEKRKSWADLVLALQTFERLSNEARQAT
ncbi:uracil-DNA glycosylase [Povalibacter sp.]|uniref:uracil-DNA glycosylase n=1 Tax=Povalibacter sp. TaxID=1962978 RepID=UPI002F42DD66